MNQTGTAGPKEMPPCQRRRQSARRFDVDPAAGRQQPAHRLKKTGETVVAKRGIQQDQVENGAGSRRGRHPAVRIRLDNLDPLGLKALANGQQIPPGPRMRLNQDNTGSPP